MRERSLLAQHEPLEEGEAPPSGIRRVEAPPVADVRLEVSAELRATVARRLLQDAGLPELAPVPETDLRARVEYSEAVQAKAAALYDEWMRPVVAQFEAAMRRASPNPARSRLLRQRMEDEIRTAFHQPLHDEGADGLSDGEHWGAGRAETPLDVLREKALALRAIVGRSKDWMRRLDRSMCGQGWVHDTAQAWEKALAGPEETIVLNRVLGFAGISPDWMPESARKERLLVLEEGTDALHRVDAGEDEASANARARDQGERFRHQADTEKERAVERVRALAEAKRAIESDLLPRFQNLPDVLHWQRRATVEEIEGRVRELSGKILATDRRQGSLQRHLESERAQGLASSADAVEAEQNDLRARQKELRIHLLAVQGAYRSIGKIIEGLEAADIAIDRHKEVGLAQLLRIVENELVHRTGSSASAYAQRSHAA